MKRTPHPYESKHHLQPKDMQVVIDSSRNPALCRKDLRKFLSKHYPSWCQRGVWLESHSLIPISDSDLSRSGLVERFGRWISIDRKNDDDAAIVVFRSFITHCGMLATYEGLKDWHVRENKKLSRWRGQTAASEAKRDIVADQMKGRGYEDEEEYNKEYTRQHAYVKRTLKRGVNLKKITDGLGLGMLLIGGRRLLQLIEGSDMTHPMLDCLVDYIKTSEDPRLARVSKAAKILESTVEKLVANVPLLSWEKFQPTLKKLEAI